MRRLKCRSGKDQLSDRERCRPKAGHKPDKLQTHRGPKKEPTCPDFG